VWAVPGTSVFVASSFAMVAEVSSRVDDFSNNIRCLLYRDWARRPHVMGRASVP